MSIDIPTMVAMVAFMQVLCGGLLIAASFFYRDEPAGFWWGTSQILLAGGVALSVAGGLTETDWITGIAFIFFVTCAAMQWHGTRLLARARSLLPLIFVGPVLVAAVDLLPVGDALPIARGIVATILNLTYFGGALYILWRSPSESLAAFKPLGLLFIANIIAIGLGPLGALGSTGTGLPPLLSIGGFIYLEGQLFVLGSTIFVVAAMRERKEQWNRNAATTDSLTGLPNRRSFFDRGNKLIERGQAEGTPDAVLMVDLDHFKSINDRFGHAAGDKILTVFATTAHKALRPNDILGRIGGEEFAVILPGTDAEAAVAIAERMRKAFEVAAEFIDGQPIKATLCAGVAASFPGATLEVLVSDADAALYSAKRNGRNQVEFMGNPLSPAPTPSSVTRVA